MGSAAFWRNFASISWFPRLVSMAQPAGAGATCAPSTKREEATLGLRTTLAAAVMISAAALCGCNRQAATVGAKSLTLTGSSYCTPFPTANANPSPAGGLAASPDPAVAFDDCIHRWGYALAPSRDPADVVAQASVQACSSILETWSQQLASQGYQQAPEMTRRGRGSPQQQQPDRMTQQMRAAGGRALFYVVQARAGGCAAPPANTLLSPTAPHPPSYPTSNPPG